MVKVTSLTLTLYFARQKLCYFCFMSLKTAEIANEVAEFTTFIWNIHILSLPLRRLKSWSGHYAELPPRPEIDKLTIVFT